MTDVLSREVVEWVPLSQEVVAWAERFTGVRIDGDGPAAPSATQPAATLKVIVIKKPTMIKADKTEMQNMDRAAAAVKTRAIVYVNDAYGGLIDTVEKWVLSTNPKILKMKDDPPSSFNLLVTMAASLAGVAGAAFPEIAIAAAIVAAAGGTAAAVPDNPSDGEREAVTAVMDQLALAVHKLAGDAKTVHQNQIDAALKDFESGAGQFWSDPDILKRLANGGDSDLDWIITEKLGFRLGKDQNPQILKNVEMGLNEALRKAIRERTLNADAKKKFTPIEMSFYAAGVVHGDEKKEIDDWIVSYNADWEKKHSDPEGL